MNSERSISLWLRLLWEKSYLSNAQKKNTFCTIYVGKLVIEHLPIDILIAEGVARSMIKVNVEIFQSVNNKNHRKQKNGKTIFLKSYFLN